VAPPTRNQLAWRGRVEAALRIVAPVLDLVLAVGDRVSRVAGFGRPRPPLTLPGRGLPGGAPDGSR
jgi:hypothetical protein